MKLKRFVLTLLLASLAGVAMASVGSAAALDTVPPAIRHDAVTAAYSDANLIFKADVTDESALERVNLFFRTKGSTSYYALSMKVVLGEYRAAIPATYMQPGAIQYYIQAIDVAGNVATWPAVGAAKNPQTIVVEKDTTSPRAELVLPRRAVSKNGFVAIIALNDKANNIDPATAQVVVNGENLTEKAEISNSRVMFTVPASLVATRSTLQVEISDMAGNRVTRNFRVWEAMAWSRELRVDMKEGEAPESRFETAFSWGPLALSASVRSDDPMITKEPGQPTSAFSMAYKARLMELEAGDISSTQAPLAMNSVRHRGADLTLRLGPLALEGVYGFPKVYVENEDYQRKVIGLHTKFDTRFLDFSLNAVRIRDDWSEAIEGSINNNPELNYVVDAQAGVGLFGDKLSLNVETAASLYFANARGDLWKIIDSLKEDYDTLPDMLKTVVDYTDKVPESARSILELPDITKGPFLADLGGQATLKVPLPWSNLTGRIYHFGKDFKTISGSGDRNVDGAQAKFATSRWFGVMQFSAEAEKRLDNAISLLDYVLQTDPLERTLTNSYGAKVSLGPTGKLNLDISASYKDQAPDGATQLDLISQGYTAAVKNLRFGLLGLKFRLGGLYGMMEQENPGDPTADKSTVTYKANSGVDIGNWSYDFNYGLKQEQDATGTPEVTSPSMDGSITWRIRRPRLLFVTLYEIRFQAEGDYNYNLDSAGAKSDEKLTLKGEAETRLTSGLRLAASYKSVRKDWGEPENTLTGLFRLRF